MRDPADYTLRWPSQIVAEELQRLIDIADVEGTSREWLDEVDRLLRQAFVTDVPAEDFERVRETTWLPGPTYGDEEPF